jgi:tRNA A-37 threonylcarbamoyl transferase component Bud32
MFLVEGTVKPATRVVRVDQVLRLLPGRRLVARVEVAGRPLLLKLFLGSASHRYQRREIRGCRVLAAAGVNTPRLLAEVADSEGQMHGIVFELIHDALPVADNQLDQVVAAAIEMARLHDFGAWHGDLHLDNFLHQDEVDRVYLVDGDGVRAGRRRPLGVAASIENLAVLCAQRQPLLDVQLNEVLGAYAQARGWSAAGSEFAARLAALGKATHRQRRRRVRRYLRKTQRDCSEFYSQRDLRRYFVCLRGSMNDAFERFAKEPEQFFDGAEMLKDGNSATVVRTRIGERVCIVKRYNVKGFWHGLRRIFKPRARFRLAWCNGQRLHFLGIPTARPVALLERRFGPLRGVAYLVMEDAGREDLSGRASDGGLSDEQVARVVRLFSALKAARLTHGDTKASNFLVAQDQVALVDLDAMHEDVAGLPRDIDRFLANWLDQPELRERFRRHFVEARLPVRD